MDPYFLFAWLLPMAVMFAAALVLGRLWLLLVPVVWWPVFYAGLYAGWWGHGVGDGWQFAALMATGIGLAIVGLGLILHQATRRWLHLTRSTD